ncbi:MAG: response regulator [Myxococcales bacterium]|nr:response regulator [Myxococcales bacterium]
MSNILLCVDDSVTMQTVAEITFRKSNWEYVGARNNNEAKSSASTKPPCLILVDAVMPDGSGYDLAKELKAAHSGAVVVMMCGNSEVYDEGKGAAAGCDGHIVKPWQTDKVVEKLAEFVSAGPSASAPAAAAAAPAAKPVADAGPPRSATLMGMPALEMPPSKPLPAGVAAIKPSLKIPAAVKPAIPEVKAPQSPSPVAAKPAAQAPAPVAAAKPAATRKPMIKAQPGKPIRLVLASQAEAMATGAAQSGGMSSDQASALGDVSREMLERIIWEVVPDLAESIIRENLDTLTAKAR